MLIMKFLGILGTMLLSLCIHKMEHLQSGYPQLRRRTSELKAIEEEKKSYGAILIEEPWQGQSKLGISTLNQENNELEIEMKENDKLR